MFFGGITSCTACLKACPTNALQSPYKLNPAKCISYLTIEHRGVIPLKLRFLIGNRIYGCDDCQLACPWNKFKKLSIEPDFSVRNNLDDISLAQLWQWDKKEFLDKTQGMAIRRIGFERWQRNLAVAIGNTGNPDLFIPLLRNKKAYSDLTAEHIAWAIGQLDIMG